MNAVNTGCGLVLWFCFQVFVGVCWCFGFFCWLVGLFAICFCFFFFVTIHHEIFSCDHDFIMGRKKDINLSVLLSKLLLVIFHTQSDSRIQCRKHASICFCG